MYIPCLLLCYLAQLLQYTWSLLSIYDGDQKPVDCNMSNNKAFFLVGIHVIVL